MADVKLTKTQLKIEKETKSQLEKYLPTLQLKKSQLQIEVQAAKQIASQLEKEFERSRDEALKSMRLFGGPNLHEVLHALEIRERIQYRENIAGVDLQVYENTTFRNSPFLLFDAPEWVDLGMEQLRALIALHEKLHVQKGRIFRLEEELMNVSIRMNLFEKRLIPEKEKHIKRIKIHLSDVQMAAVSCAKIAKKRKALRVKQ